MSPEQSSGKIGKSVGEKLRAARIAQHYTQSQLATPDFSVSYISAIERGQIHPSLRALEILAGRLGLSSTQLLPAKSQQEERHTSSLIISERDEDEIELVLLEANIAIRQEMVEQAIAQLEKLSSRRIKRSQQLQQRYLLGWAHFVSGQFQECDYILTEAIQIAKDLNDNYQQLRILNLQAQTQAAMRNYAQALLAHQRCLNILETEEVHDPFFSAQVYMHMGQHYTQLENTRQALEMFHKAIDIVENLTTTRAVQTAYWELCRQYSESKAYDLASLYAYKSAQVSTQEMGKQLKSELYYYLGRALINMDDEQARTFLDEALEREGVKQDALTLASIYTRYAEWYFKRGDLQQSEQSAQKACELAQPAGDTMIGAEAHIIRGRIAYEQKRTETGDEHFIAGLDMLERTGGHEEMANESVRYAELLESSGKEREAFTYFRRAFQSQQKLGK
jgi:tetratricopeptide (TPR) repeat protein